MATKPFVDGLLVLSHPFVDQASVREMDVRGLISHLRIRTTNTRIRRSVYRVRLIVDAQPFVDGFCFTIYPIRLAIEWAGVI